MKQLIVLLVTIVAASALTVHASDLAREQRVFAEIEEAILDGEPLEMVAGKTEFMAIHTTAESRPVLGGIILVHGMGAHPDWADIIHPLRTALPAYGWETLALQMPLTIADAEPGAYSRLDDEAVARIKAGVDFYSTRQIKNIVLIGHSLGARQITAYLANEVPDDVRAVITIGLGGSGEQQKQIDGVFSSLQIPLLDIYGSQDLQQVKENAGSRRKAAQSADKSDFRQIEVTGADHFFRGLEQTLITKIRSWISKKAKSKEIEGTGERPQIPGE
ncbi:MAG: alpha/beta fold hydrolase [Gammaproteobacteria bacterium]|nr:alpha/beta fold hydrolase [Gammaproteobacteria bacterium]